MAYLARINVTAKRVSALFTIGSIHSAIMFTASADN